jgi:hypothetical protein
MIHNNLRQASLLRAEIGGPTLRLPHSIRFAEHREFTVAAHPDVHLIHCSAPIGVLEPAPRTSLIECLDGEAWDGFWSVGDERYYTRRTRANGRQQWFRFADEEVALRRSREPRVLPFRRKGGGQPFFSARQTMVVGTRGSRTILVGSSRRERRTLARGASR